MLTIYKIIILPVFDYCDFLIFRISQQDSESLQKLQNCTFRTILRVEKLTPTTWTHETLDMSTLQQKSHYAAIQIFKSLNDMFPERMGNVFEYIHEKHDLSTRQSTSLQLEVTKVQWICVRRNIRYFGPVLWQQVPMDVRTSDRLVNLKQDIKNVKFT